MLVEMTEAGFFCEAGGFYIDPVKPVENAVVTHAHADHARPGSLKYFAARSSEGLLQKRLGAEISLRGLEFGERIRFGRVTVSLHPAGHILGSAQVRVECDGEVWVVSGDYKRDEDPTCERFEVVPCDTFVTEATFALPIYRWPSTEKVVGDIFEWWKANRAQGRASVLFCYSLGKAQRVLAALRNLADRPVLLHGAVVPLTEIYREAGVEMVDTEPAVREGVAKRAADYGEDLIIAPPGANGTAWMKRFGKCSTAFCSGWMQVRGNRRRRGHDRGFVLSDHVDWEGLVGTIEETGARRVFATHGRSDVLVRYLQEKGLEAAEIVRSPTIEYEDSEAMEAGA